MSGQRSSAPAPWWRLLVFAPSVLFLAAALLILTHTRAGSVPDSIAGPPMLLFSLIGMAAALRVVALRRLDRRIRRAWCAMAAGFFLILVSSILFGVAPGFPGPGDIPRLAAVPCLLVGLLMMSASPRTRTERLRTGLDIGVTVAGGFMALWFWSLGPMITTKGVGGLALTVAASYPLADLVLLFGAAAALLRGARATSRRPLILTTLGLLALILADLQYAGAELADRAAGVPHPDSSHTVQWLTLLGAFCLLSTAALVQGADAGADRPHRVRTRPFSTVTLLPYGAIAGGYALLLAVAAGAPLYPWGGLIVGAMVMTGLVVARQVLVLRENSVLLATDYLTGVATRPAFTHALSRSLDRASRTGTGTAVLVIDLDGFKAVNDALGHDAGDELLVAFAGVLRGAVGRDDTVGRLGGDEFAVVLTAIRDPDDAVAVVLRLLDRMSAPLAVSGREITGRASIGIATSRPDDTVRQLLDRADQAMYHAKRTATGWSLAPDAPARRPAAESARTLS